VLALAGLLTAALSALLWPQWRHNPDLSHGLFMPVIFVLLVYESRRRGPGRYLPETPLVKTLRVLAVLGGLALVTLGGLFAAAVGWSHALVDFVLAAALAALLFAALLWLASDTVRRVPFNWTSLVAVALWPLSAPIPPGTYQRLTLSLQLWVTQAVVHGLHLLGIPATTMGNVIELAHTQVGVEEACSGVRSLISCLVAGFFFSATLVRRPWARALLIAISAPLAVAMNLLRSLTLTLFANAGVDIVGFWHDLTGFAVLGGTALILGGLALWLEDERVPAAPPQPASSSAGSGGWGVPAGLAAAALLAAFFAFNTHGATRTNAVAPDLERILPVNAPGWQVITTGDLYRFSATLETDRLVQRTYVRNAPSGPPLQVTVYLAYWAAGQVPVSAVSAHTPEACWPGSGWTARPQPVAPSPFRAGDRVLPAPEYRLFASADYPQHVWYWHLYDGRPIAQIDPRSPRALLALALRYGFRTAGDQLFVRISSNQPWEALQDDPLVIEVLSRLRPFGL
jgi:exosortase